MKEPSNTLVPTYYGRFRQDVLDGKIPVSREVSMEMNRIDMLIESPSFYYDPYAIEGFTLFCENELCLTDGSPVNLLPSFKLWAEQLFCWSYPVRQSVWFPDPDNPSGGHFETQEFLRRLTNKQYIIAGRGSAKSMYDFFVQAYFLCIDRTTTHQVTVAPTMVQAEEVLSPFRTSLVRARGPFFKFMTHGSIQNTTGSKMVRPKLASTKRGIENFSTNSYLEIRTMRIDKLQGLRCKVATVDEWLSGDTKEDVIGAIEQGASKGNIPDYVILATSSEGTVRNGVGDDIKMELMSILKGEQVAPHVSIWWYKLDEVAEVGNPELWIKANPNLGMTVSMETYERDVARAEANPTARNDILAKRFGLPMEGYTYFFTYEETLPHHFRDYYGMRCAVGADLSQGDDFCAFTFMFPLGNGMFGIKLRSYITTTTLRNLPISARVKYQQFIDEGTLIIMDGVYLDMMVVYDELTDFIQRNDYDVCSFGYDPYNAKGFVERWEREFGPYGIEKVPQGVRTESVPLGELKDMATERLLLFDSLLMQYSMGNTICIQDTNGNYKLYKRRREDKIDNVAALMDAWVSYKNNMQAFE